MGILPLPYTSIVRHKTSDLVRVGILIKWIPKNKEMLETLHNAVIRLVLEVEISGLADIADRERKNERVARSMGKSYHELFLLAAQSRDAIPVLDDVLRHVRRFM